MSRIEKIERSQMGMLILGTAMSLGLRFLLTRNVYHAVLFMLFYGSLIGICLSYAIYQWSQKKLVGYVPPAFRRATFINLMNGFDFQKMNRMESAYFYSSISINVFGAGVFASGVCRLVFKS